MKTVSLYKFHCTNSTSDFIEIRSALRDHDSSVGIVTRYEMDEPGIESNQSRWRRSLKRGSVAACLLGLWVRIPPGDVGVRVVCVVQ